MNVSEKHSTAIFELDRDLTGEESTLFQDELKKCVAKGLTNFNFQFSEKIIMDPTAICALIALKKQMGEVLRFQGQEKNIIFDLILQCETQNEVIDHKLSGGAFWTGECNIRIKNQ